MGCGGSVQKNVGDDRISKRLMEEYEVGDQLGEGAFGVVYSCTSRKTKEEVAVKMVDKVETPIEAIKKEADMLKALSHYNIVKFHQVYFEKCFVCIVMDKYSGGDLIDGLHLHLREKGKIQCYSIMHVSAQMAASVQYIHKRSIVHRDIKGDNYLMDRKNIADTQCRIALTDFGTATHIEADERLSAEVGTKIFWAPEVFSRSYGIKVDIWAMGVTMYGLLDGHFPFKDEHEIQKKTKVLKYPRLDPDCEDYVRSMLRREEDKRISAEEIMAHSWIRGSSDVNKSPGQLPGHAALTELDDTTPRCQSNMRDDVNAGIKQRRLELVERLDQGAKKENEKTADSQHYLSKWFTVADKRAGTAFKFEWWEEARVRKSGMLSMAGMAAQAEEALGDQDKSPQVVGQMLKDCNIDITKFGVGTAKSLEHLAGEVQSGAARLMLDATDYKKLVRVVDIVLLRLYSSSEGDGKNTPLVLVETGEKYPNGIHRETNRIPGAKKLPHETCHDVAKRVLREFLNMGEVSVKFDNDVKESFEEEIISPSFPGVSTVYRKEILKCWVDDSRSDQLTSIGLPKGDSFSAEETNGQLRYFGWMTEKQATAKQVKLRAHGSEEVSGLVMAPIGLSEDDLVVALKRGNVDPALYVSPAKTIKEFSKELTKGESSLMQDSDGGLVRVVDTVLLKLVNPQATEMLVQTETTLGDGSKKAQDSLPMAMRRPDENQFLTAKRILRRHLKIDENRVKLNATSVRYFQSEELVPLYPSITTVFRTRVISARLKKGRGE